MTPNSKTWLRQTLIKKKTIPYICEICKNDGNWNNKPLALHLDHKNGNREDDNISNLRFLCPNCHGQEPTSHRKKLKSPLLEFKPQILKMAREGKTKRHILDTLGFADAGTNYKTLSKLLDEAGILYHVPRPPKEELESLQGEKNINEICKRYAVAQSTVYNWLNHYKISVKCYVKPNPVVGPTYGKGRINLSQRKVERPTKEELYSLVWSVPTSKLSKRFGVSDVAVAKWCKLYNISKPAPGYWAKIKSANAGIGEPPTLRT